MRDVLHCTLATVIGIFLFAAQGWAAEWGGAAGL